MIKEYKYAHSFFSETTTTRKEYRTLFKFGHHNSKLYTKMKPSIFTLYFVGLAAAIPAPQIEIPAAGPNTSQIILGTYQYAGTGCSPHSGSVIMQKGDNKFVVDFPQLKVESGPTAKASDQIRDCTLTLNLEYPSGFQASIAKAEYQGYAILNRGAHGRSQSMYFFTTDGDVPSLRVWCSLRLWCQTSY